MTTVIDPTIRNAMTKVTQGARTELYGGRRVYPQFHCCISGNTVGVYKDPVAILDVSETELCDFTPISVAFGTSYSASSTIQTWSVDWDDGNVSNGAWPPAGAVDHPAGGYVFPGVYTIILTPINIYLLI